MDNVSIKSHL